MKFCKFVRKQNFGVNQGHDVISLLDAMPYDKICEFDYLIVSNEQCSFLSGMVTLYYSAGQYLQGITANPNPTAREKKNYLPGIWKPLKGLLLCKMSENKDKDENKLRHVLHLHKFIFKNTCLGIQY